MSPKFFLFALAIAAPRAQAVPQPAKPAQPPQPVCSTLTDSFCDRLFDDAHNGYMQVFDGQIVLGKSEKSKEERRLLIDLRALVDAGPRLPVDLRDRALPILANLKAVLDDEAASGKWTVLQRAQWEDRLAHARDDFKDLKKLVFAERLAKQMPQIADKDPEDWKKDESIDANAVEDGLDDEILDAKYANHPNWIRINDLFAEVKQRLLVEADKLPVGPEQKAFIIKQYSTVKLSLPYPDPRRTSADADCASTTLNAFYDGERHVYTVCAGWFNANQSKSALMQVTAHEMSHSIDAGATATYFHRAKSPMSHALSKLINMKNVAPYSCDQWNTLVTQIKAHAPAAPTHYNALEHLYRCLVPKKLEAFDTHEVASLMRDQARTDVGTDADNKYYSRIDNPSYVKHGQTEQNEYFLRPDIALADENNFFWYPDYHRDQATQEIYTQDLICQAQKAGKPLQDMSELQRATLMDAAIQTTTDITAADYVDGQSYCGENCDLLVSSGMSSPPNEAFADWMAGKVVSSYLRDLPGDIDHKRDASGVVMASFCAPPGPEHDAPVLAAHEKRWSLEPHPEDRVRRLSIYTPATASLLKCDIKAGEEGFGSCVP